jgi:hypothetical protein
LIRFKEKNAIAVKIFGKFHHKESGRCITEVCTISISLLMPGCITDRPLNSKAQKSPFTFESTGWVEAFGGADFLRFVGWSTGASIRFDSKTGCQTPERTGNTIVRII